MNLRFETGRVCSPRGGKDTEKIFRRAESRGVEEHLPFASFVSVAPLPPTDLQGQVADGSMSPG